MYWKYPKPKKSLYRQTLCYKCSLGDIRESSYRVRALDLSFQKYKNEEFQRARGIHFWLTWPNIYIYQEIGNSLLFPIMFSKMTIVLYIYMNYLILSKINSLVTRMLVYLSGDNSYIYRTIVIFENIIGKRREFPISWYVYIRGSDYWFGC